MKGDLEKRVKQLEKGSHAAPGCWRRCRLIIPSDDGSPAPEWYWDPTGVPGEPEHEGATIPDEDDRPPWNDDEANL